MIDDAPSAVIERARLAIDPLRAMNAFRTVEELRRWTDARPGRVMRATTVKLTPTDLVGMALVELYQDGLLVASGLDANWFQALGTAIQIASGS